MTDKDVPTTIAISKVTKFRLIKKKSKLEIESGKIHSFDKVILSLLDEDDKHG